MPNWKKLIISGSDAALNSLEITSHLTASGLIYPTADGITDQAIITDGAGNLTFSNPSAGSVTIAVKNISGGTLTKGTPVFITGSVGASNTVEIDAADASDASKMPATGILSSDLTNNAEGFATTNGFLRNITTDPIDGVTPDPNDTVYVKAGGGLTLTKPTGATNLIQNIGKVGKVSSGGAGSIIVSSILRTNDIPNLPEGKIWVGNGNTVVSDTVYLDETNDRLGIGTTTPTQALDVVGKIALNDGGNSVFIGTNAGRIDDAGDNNNVGIGQNSLYTNVDGEYNVAVGLESLYSNTDGYDNTAIGAWALYTNSIGYSNTAIGLEALNSNTNGHSNSALGKNALSANSTGDANVAVGIDAMRFGGTAVHQNTALGGFALRGNTGQGNTSIGHGSLYHKAAGDTNVAIGIDAGRVLADKGSSATIINDSIFIGYRTSPLANSQTNQIVIGHDATGLGSNTIVLGNDSITTTALKGNVGIGTTTPAEKLTVEGNISGSGNVNIVGDITASAFLGDGSALTGVTGTDATKLPLTGGTLTGDLNISELASPTITLTDTTNNSTLTMLATNFDANINTSGRLAINGGTGLVIGATGNVGVGVSNPITAKFHVTGTSFLNGYSVIRGSGATSGTAALLVENSAGTDLLKVRDDGIVSIGTTTSNGTLTVSSTGTSTHTATFYSITGQTVNNTEWIVANIPVTTINAAGELAMARGMMRFNNKQNAFDNTGNLGSIYVTDDDASYPFTSVGNLILQSRGNTSRGIGFVTGNTGNLGMFLSGAGNLGIGLTADATEKLHVSGNAIVTGTMDVQGGFADDLTVSGLTPKLVINSTEGTVFDGDYFGILEWKMNDGNTGGVTATGNIQMQFNDNTSGGPAQGAVGEGADMIFNTGKVAVTGQGQVMNEGMRLTKDGAVKITQSLNVGVTTDYLDNAAAITGGLVAGDIYRTGDILKIVH